MENTVEPIKVLNLYAGIGGNRKLWENVEVTAVELDPEIAEIYQYFYPGDRVVVSDAHEYLLKNYKQFDFIWSSPPCPTHSDMRRVTVHSGQYPAVYPDLKLWQEITLLQHFAPKESTWVIENVVPYYTPIVEPTFKLARHCFWANFYAAPKKFKGSGIPLEKINNNRHKPYGFDISGFNIKDGRRLLRNLVNPEIGKYIFDTAAECEYIKEEQLGLFA